MPNVFIEPQPPGRDVSITGFTVELEGGESIDGLVYPTQAKAIRAAVQAGHNPLVARVRVTSKGKPDHWREA